MDRPPDLPQVVAELVDACSNQYVAAEKVGDLEGMEVQLRKAWELYPDPKFGWSDSQIMAHRLIGHLRDHGSALDALKLSDEQIESGTILEHESGPWLYRGTTLLALGRVDEARGILEDVLKRFGKRAFAGHDSRFLAFAETGVVPDDLFESSTGVDPTVLESEIPDETHQEIMLLSEVGDKRQLSGDWEGAVKAWRKALELVPEPKTFWEASAWLYGSIGDVLTDAALSTQQEGQAAWILADAREALIEALASPTGATNPLTLMRRGQVEHELGNADVAREHLLKAYMIEGETVFELEDPKYLDLLRASGDI